MCLVLFLVLQSALIFWPEGRFSLDRHASQEELLKTFCHLQIFCLTLLLTNSQSRLRILVLCLVFSGTFQALYGSMMTLTGVEHIWWRAKENGIGLATGTFINRNHLAGYLEMTLALGLGLMISSIRSETHYTWRAWLRSWTNTLLSEKVLIRACLVLMVIALILTRSRMGNLGFFVGLGVAGVVGLWTFRRSARGVTLLFVSIIVVDIVLMGAFFGIDELQQRFEDVSEEVSTGGGRTSVVDLSRDLIEASPLIGYGGGTFYTVFPSVRDASFAKFYRHADADIVEFPVEYGLFGVLPLLALFFVSLYFAVRVQFVRRNHFYKSMGFASTMAMVSIGFHTIGDFNLHIFANSITFMCILAIPYLAMSLPTQTTNQRPS